MWPELKIIHGKPRHSQSQGSVERANQDVENMLTTWMQTENNSHWSQGLRFVQLMKNRALHSGIKTSPYEALFGCKVKVGLSTSNLPKEVIDNLENEEQLLEIIEKNELQSDDKPTVQTQNTNMNEKLEDPISTIQSNNENAIEKRRKAKINLENQAVKMKTWSDKKLNPADVGATVRVPVPDVDKGRGDARNILAVVTEVNMNFKKNIYSYILLSIIILNFFQVTADGYYRLGTREGLLKSLYSRSQFTICQKKLIPIDEVPMENTLALRTIATQQSTGTGQGFMKCTCKSRCQTKKCLCVKNNIICSSKCHASLVCFNK